MFTIYKFALALLLLFGCGMLTVEPITGIITMLVAFALFGAQQRRERNRDEERRHREMLEVMRNNKQ